MSSLCQSTKDFQMHLIIIWVKPSWTRWQHSHFWGATGLKRKESIVNKQISRNLMNKAKNTNSAKYNDNYTEMSKSVQQSVAGTSSTIQFWTSHSIVPNEAGFFFFINFSYMLQIMSVVNISISQNIFMLFYDIKYIRNTPLVIFNRLYMSWKRRC